MTKITINRDKCKGCLLCISFCPRGLISVEKNLNRKGVRPVKFSRGAHQSSEGNNQECMGCAMCAIICPDCCIEVYR